MVSQGKQHGISSRRNIYRNMGGNIPNTPKLVETEIPLGLTLISWNINGLCENGPNTMEKFDTLRRAVGAWDPNFILLQEMHGRKNMAEVLRAEIPRYIWIMILERRGYRGVAIGVKHDKRTVLPIPPPEIDEHGRWMILPITFMREKIVLTSIYKPDKTPREFWAQLCGRLGERIAIIGGDFNARPESSEMTEILECLVGKNISLVPSK